MHNSSSEFVWAKDTLEGNLQSAMWNVSRCHSTEKKRCSIHHVLYFKWKGQNFNFHAMFLALWKEFLASKHLYFFTQTVKIDMSFERTNHVWMIKILFALTTFIILFVTALGVLDLISKCKRLEPAKPEVINLSNI